MGRVMVSIEGRQSAMHFPRGRESQKAVTTSTKALRL